MKPACPSILLSGNASGETAVDDEDTVVGVVESEVEAEAVRVDSVVEAASNASASFLF